MNGCCNLDRFSRSSRPARPGSLTLAELGNGFDSDADLSMYRTKCISYYYNIFCKQFGRNEYFSTIEFSTTGRSASESVQPV